MSESDFDEAVEAYRRASNAICKGDSGPVLELFSGRNDVTLANSSVRVAAGGRKWGRRRRAASHFVRQCRFKEISRYTTSDFCYVLHVDPAEVQFWASR